MIQHESEPTLTGKEIAIIGMAGRFPGAHNIDELWDNLKYGIETISFFSDQELEEKGINPELLKNPNYIKAYGVLEEQEFFDEAFFGYTPSEAEVMNPQMRTLHESIWEALEDAGYDPGSYQERIGLYVGALSSSYWEALTYFSGKSNDMGGFASISFCDKDFSGTRISYNLDLKGPVFSLQTACSTSLVATHIASRALLTGECQMAIAGGAAILATPKRGYIYSEGMILSADGHCRAFDAKATGTIGGEGAGAVVLKRLKIALEDNDHIYAIIKGTAINNDGKRKVGYTAPSVEAQAEVIQTALRIARIKPDSIGYIETHGTGTTLGDPVEIEALTLAFESEKTHFCALGSIKTNIGHLDAAAGIAGLIKATMTLHNRAIPPSVHFKNPNPNIDFKKSPFYINEKYTEWKRDKFPLRAGVSSFGIGGTNAHVVLEEWKYDNPRTECSPYQLILLSAKTQTALNQMTQNIAEYLKGNTNINISDVAYTLQVGRKALPHRCMAVCAGVKDATTILITPSSAKLHYSIAKETQRPIIFMFPGLGAQYVNMGKDLYENEPFFREQMNYCFEYLKPLAEINIKDVLYPGSPNRQEKISTLDNGQSVLPDSIQNYKNETELINKQEIAQLVLFIFEYSLGKLLIHWGLKPQILIGYSFGEYAAACISGVFSLEDALRIILIRGQLIQRLPLGRMLSVPLTREQLIPLLDNELSLSIDNGASCIIAGSPSSIESFDKKMKNRRIICMLLPHADHALHSPLMNPILPEFAETLKEIQFNTPKIPFISNLTGNLASMEVTKYQYWLEHLRSTVQYATGLKELAKKENASFIEVGPGRDLCALILRYIENNSELQAINIVRPAQQHDNDIAFLLNRIGRLWLYGHSIEWQNLHGNQNRSRLSLPTYPFEGNHFTIDTKVDFQKQLSDRNRALEKNSDISQWFYLPSWKPSLVPNRLNTYISTPFTWLILADTLGLGDWIIERLKAAQQEVIVVYEGKEYKKDHENIFSISTSGDINDYTTLLKELLTRKMHPDKILHLWNIQKPVSHESETEWFKKYQDNQNRGYYSLIFLVQAIEMLGITDDIQLTVFTNNMFQVYDDSIFNPERMTLLGPIKVIPKEYPNMKCRLVDISLTSLENPKKEVFMEKILSEIYDFSLDTVIVYRGNNRLLPSYEAISLEKPAESPLIRDGGIYLITGGLGDIGLLIAKDLSKRFRVKLALVGRSPFPSKEQWEHNTHTEAVLEKIKTLREIKKLGSDVLVYSADVSDYLQLERVVLETEQKFGPINGVIHAALQVDGGVIHSLTREKTENVFSAKVKGTLVLDQIFKGYPLDFMVLFSSVNSIFMGVGEVVYASASAFLDAFALYKNFKDEDKRLTISIDWEAWQEVGSALMVAKKRGETLGYSESQIKIEGILSQEGLDTFQRIMNSVYGISRIVVSTKNLNELVKIYETFKPNKALENISVSKNMRERPQLDTQYIPPNNYLEQKLTDIWSKFFGFEPLGIQDDFFDLNGDSLKAIIVASMIHQRLDIKVPIAAFFNYPTIEKLAEYIKENQQEWSFKPIVAVEKKEYYPLTPSQKRLYLSQQRDPHSTAYNILQILILEGELHWEKIENVFLELIMRHESLKTSFHFYNEELIQRVHDQTDFKVEKFLLEANKNDIKNQDHEISNPDQYEVERYTETINKFLRTFDLSHSPLLRVGIAKVETNKHLLMTDMHHIISDGVSYPILVQEFILLYMKKQLPILKLQYKDYAQWQNLLYKNDDSNVRKQEIFWLNQFSGKIPQLNLKRISDYEDSGDLGSDADYVTFKIEKTLFEKLQRMSLNFQATLFMLLLGIYNILLSKYTMQEDIIIGSPITGRNHPDTEGIIGVFVNMLTLRNYPNGKKNVNDFFKEIKEKTINALENEDYQFDQLILKLGLQGSTKKNPLFETVFNMLNIDNEVNVSQNEIDDLKINSYVYDNPQAQFDLIFSVKEMNNRLDMLFTYNKGLFKKETITQMASDYLNIAQQIVEDYTIKLADIKLTHELSTLAANPLRNEDDGFDF